MPSLSHSIAAFTLASLALLPPARGGPADRVPVDYVARAREVTEFIQTNYLLPESGLYATSLSQRTPEFMWGNGIVFSALVGAARHDPSTYAPALPRFFVALDRYWDAKASLPGYEPAPTAGNGNDKYYDDNAWMVLTFMEAYELTGDERYKSRALDTLRFVLSGWDDERGGGIWWHELHKDDAKNTCVNAPAAVGCLVVARHLPADQAKAKIDWAERLVAWTVTHLEAEDGLFEDHIKVASGNKNRDKLTYNTGLMIRAYIGLHHTTGDGAWLEKAKRASKAADWFTSDQTGAYRDNVKWSHLQVEADLEMYRLTGERYLLERAQRNADDMYARFRQNTFAELIEVASVARTLWLLADTQTHAGKTFWERVEKRR